MPTPDHGYRIDYDDLDVTDLVAQIRERVERRAAGRGQRPELVQERIRGRLRTYVDVDEERGRRLQASLGLEGDWNVSPEDLRQSSRRGLGRLISLCRAAARPALKLAANLDLPLYKQHQVNLGLAEAVHDLLQENAELRARLEALDHRLADMEAGTDLVADHGSLSPDDAGHPTDAGRPSEGADRSRDAGIPSDDVGRTTDDVGRTTDDVGRTTDDA